MKVSREKIEEVEEEVDKTAKTLMRKKESYKEVAN